MGHYYELTSDGVMPRHYVEMATKPGEFRQTRITDVKKAAKNGQVWHPSVTTVLDVLAKHALVDWKINQNLSAAYALNPANYQTVDLYIDGVRYKADMEMDKAPSAGTDFHKNMEKYLLEEGFEDELCRKVHLRILDEVGAPSTWKPEINVYSDLGYAGQCDLFIPKEDRDHAWIIDYKTKQFAKQWKPKKMGYWDSHLTQLMAYGMELEPTGLIRVANVFVCLETGDVEFYEWTDEKLKTKAWDYFLAALNLWQIKNL